MFRNRAAARGRMGIALSSSILVLCNAPVIVHAQSADAVPWEDRAALLDESLPDRDVNEAPLFLLSGEEAWGIVGAGTIGRIRSHGPIASEQDFTARTGLPAVPGYAYGDAVAGVSWDWEWRAVKSGEFAGRSGRVAWRRGHWSIPVRWEGDGGLERWNDRTTGAIAWNRGGMSILLGHYDLRFGNGFLVDSSPGWGTPSRPSAGGKTRLRPYDSRVENRAFFGSAALFDRGTWKFGAGLSRHRRDARIDDDDLASSWDETGYHRTASERRSRSRVHETFASGWWEFALGSGTVSLTGFSVSYDPAWSGGSHERKPDAFQGDFASGWSAGAEFPWHSVEMSMDLAAAGGPEGEAARLSIRRPGKRAFQIILQRLGEGFHAMRSGAYHRLRSSPRGQESALALARGPGVGGTIDVRMLAYRSLGRTFFEPGGESGAEFRTAYERRRLRLEWERRREWDSGIPEDRVRSGARFRWTRSFAGVQGSLAPFWIVQRETRTDGARNASGTGAILSFGPLQFSMVRLLERDAALVLPAVTLGGGFPARSYGRSGGLWRARGTFDWDGPGQVETSFVFAEGEWGVLLRKRGQVH